MFGHPVLCNTFPHQQLPRQTISPHDCPPTLVQIVWRHDRLMWGTFVTTSVKMTPGDPRVLSTFARIDPCDFTQGWYLLFCKMSRKIASNLGLYRTEEINFRPAGFTHNHKNPQSRVVFFRGLHPASSCHHMVNNSCGRHRPYNPHPLHLLQYTSVIEVSLGLGSLSLSFPHPRVVDQR